MVNRADSGHRSSRRSGTKRQSSPARGRWTMAGALVLVTASALFTGCSDGGSSGRAGAETTTQPAESATIDSFVVPASANCAATETSVSVPVEYAATGAARLELRVDGLPSEVTPPGGSVTVDVHCDPLPHQFVLLAYDEDDRRTTEQRALTTVLGK